MAIGDARGRAVAEAAGRLVAEIGRPSFGVVLGSGLGGIARRVGSGGARPWPAIGSPARPASSGHPGGIAAAEVGGARGWLFTGRAHLHEGVDARAAAFPCELLAAAGARSVLLTSAVGGLAEGDRPGDFAVVRDHLNLTGDDPVRHVAVEHREPAFVNLHDAYDPAWSAAFERAARSAGRPCRPGVLAAVAGPAYETPAEVRMLRALGADLASMSVVPETLLARHLGLRVAAVVCIANLGAGLGGGAIRHETVLDVVARSAAGAAWLVDALAEGVAGA